MKIKLITYGNIPEYSGPIRRLTLQAKYMGFFSEVVSETDISISEDPEFSEILKNDKDFCKTFNSRIGGGYWIWKPYIIYKHLSKLDSGDLLYYADAGCMLSVDNKTRKDKTLKKLWKYSSWVGESTQGVYTSELHGHPEKDWTKRSVFDFFGGIKNKKLYNTNQYEGGRHIIKKCPFSMKIYEQWWDIAKSHPQLFEDDRGSMVGNSPTFKHHRHDQSVWSLLCKTNKVNECVDRFARPMMQKVSPPIRTTRCREGDAPGWLLDWAKENEI